MARSGRPRRHGRVREASPPRYTSESFSGIVGVVYDSDVIIEILRERAEVVTWARDLEQSGVPTYCTPVAWAEVYAGVRPGEEPITQEFFEARGEIVIDAAIGRRAGAYLARYSRSHGVEIADALVAAAAATAGLHLWTLNRKHYPMPDVRFYQP
jgi:predicted nucleic acid-binding protein